MSVIRCGWMVFLVLTLWGWGNTLVVWEKKLDADIQVLGKERDDSLEKLNTGFVRALGRVQKAAQEAADLDLLVETRKFKEALESGEKLPASENEELKKLTVTLNDHTKEVLSRYGASVNKLIDDYADRLKIIQDAHTRSGDVEKALEIRKIIKAAELRRIEDLSEVSEPERGLSVDGQTRHDGRIWPKPLSKSKLHEFLTNTVWSVKDGYFRFRGDGTMTMPWHDFKWEVTKHDEVKMYTTVWHFVVTFGDDMKTLRVEHRHNGKKEWEGTFVRRFSMAHDQKKSQEILLQGKWKREIAPGMGEFTFTKNGKVQSASGKESWEEWEYVDGLIRLNGTENDKRIYLDVTITGERPPYKLMRVGREMRDMQFEQKK